MENCSIIRKQVMPMNTLISLAMLKVNIDQGKDYLDYLRPFILHVLVEYSPDPITNSAVKDCIREQFGLEVPERTIEIVLKRIARHHSIKRVDGTYRKIGDLPDPQIISKQASAGHHIRSVLSGLQQFSRETITPIDNDDNAIDAVCSFLAEFDVTCLRAYLRGTAIPQFAGTHPAHVTLVSSYVQHLRRSSPERFEGMMVLVQGHMLANALLCPDLEHLSPTYKNVAFYFDTPLLFHALGLEGEPRENAARDLIRLLSQLGGKVVAFSHSCEELRRVLRAIAGNLNSSIAPTLIVREARKGELTRSDLLFLSESIDEKFNEMDIHVETTPRHQAAFQIDEEIFEEVLNDEVSYQNPRAKEDDINSVRSIYVLRADKSAPSIEKARAVFVTSNTSFARAAWAYGQRYESSRDVSSVITSFSLANLAWLKAPVGAPSVPRTQVLAFAYAALQPSLGLLNKYMNAIDKLEAKGNISQRDHQILRSSPLAYDELMNLTLGEDSALTEETLMQALERVSGEIRKKESTKLMAEQEAHRTTRHDLESSREQGEEMRRRIYWKCQTTASLQSRIIAYFWGSLMLAGLCMSITLPIIGSLTWAFVAMPFILIVSLISFVSRWYGISVKDMRKSLELWLLSRLLRRESAVLGLEVDVLTP